MFHYFASTTGEDKMVGRRHLTATSETSVIILIKQNGTNVNTLRWRQPFPVAAPSRAQACCRTLAGIAGSNPAVGTDVSLL